MGANCRKYAKFVEKICKKGEFPVNETLTIDGDLPNVYVTPPHYSLEPIFLGPLEVVIWEIDG